MKISEALAKTMTEFNLGLVATATKAGITYARLSRYLSGIPIKTDGLDEVLGALDDKAFRSFVENLIIDRGLTIVPYDPDRIPRPITELSAQETSDVLNAIARKIRAEGVPHSGQSQVSGVSESRVW